MYPAALNEWETAVLKTESKRCGFKFWYRNPSRPSQDSLGVAYVDGEDIRIVRPDFLFFAQLMEGAIVADIVDPHGLQFGDALPKFLGGSKALQKSAANYACWTLFIPTYAKRL